MFRTYYSVIVFYRGTACKNNLQSITILSGRKAFQQTFGTGAFDSSSNAEFKRETRNFEFKPVVSELEVSILRKGSTFPEDSISPTKRTFRSAKHRARYYASIPNTISHPRKQIRRYIYIVCQIYVDSRRTVERISVFNGRQYPIYFTSEAKPRRARAPHRTQKVIIQKERGGQREKERKNRRATESVDTRHSGPKAKLKKGGKTWPERDAAAIPVTDLPSQCIEVAPSRRMQWDRSCGP